MVTFDPCPRCGDDVGAVVTTDPGIETMAPCGCRVALDGGTVEDGIDRPDICVDTLDYDGAETHQDSIEGEVTRHYYSCPYCEHPISTWMDCPECLWYDEDVWTRTLAERGESA